MDRMVEMMLCWIYIEAISPDFEILFSFWETFEYDYCSSDELIDHIKWAINTFCIFFISIIDMDFHDTSMHMWEMYM